MGEVHDRVEDPDVRPFRTDVDKMTTRSRRGPAWPVATPATVDVERRLPRGRELPLRPVRPAVPRRAPGERSAGAGLRRGVATTVMNIHHADLDPKAQIGPGLLLMHHTGVFVGGAVIGDNCVMHHNVTIGQRVASGDQGVPRLGDNVWIGPGATITGDVTIGDGADDLRRQRRLARRARTRAGRRQPGAGHRLRLRQLRDAQLPRTPSAGRSGRSRAGAGARTRNGTRTQPEPAQAQRPDAAHVDRALAEYARLRDPDGDRHLEAVKAAIFLEDVFHVVLREEQIDPDLLGTAEGMRAVLARAGGTA